MGSSLSSAAGDVAADLAFLAENHEAEATVPFRKPISWTTSVKATALAGAGYVVQGCVVFLCVFAV